MRLRVLGPIQVRDGDQWRSLGAPKWRALLAALLVRSGQGVSVEQLIDDLWGDEPPRNGANQIHGYVVRLRRALDDPEGTILTSRSPGYALRIDELDVDVRRFDDLLAQGLDAQRGGDAERAAKVLSEALGLWRGPALADAPSTLLVQTEANRLEERRLVALEARIDADLTLGRHDVLVPELKVLTQEHPLRERFWAQLMLGLYRSGRQSDALAAYQRLYRLLDDEIGVEPGPPVRELHQQILASDPSLDGVEARQDRAGSDDVPRQLPVAVRHFAGRAEALERLDELAAASCSEPGAVIAAITGTAGIGKTSTAVHWAHRVAERFPDGQLYVNLRGFHPTETPVSPETVVRGFLDALSVPPERIPIGFESRVGLYRSLVADRRMLVILDNARDADHVRPLLPGGASCFVVVTSRDRLSGLVAAEGAHPVTLGLLADDEARELLARSLGADRIAGEPRAIATLIDRCARLPLALTIVAASAIVNRTLTLDGLASELADTRARLDNLDTGEPATSMRAVLSWSYRGRSTEARRLFRLLGVHPGPDFTASAAASLAGIPVTDAKRLLAELTRVHLVAEHRSGRFTFHDLLRAYATELAWTDDSESERGAATRRALDHYLHTAHGAALLLAPYRESIELGSPEVGIGPERLADHHAATTWFTAEQAVMLAAVAQAAEQGLDTHAWALAWTLVDFLDWQGSWPEWIATQDLALDAARRLADGTRQATSHRYLANGHTRLGDYADAHAHLKRALSLFVQLENSTGQAYSHRGLARVFGLQGRYNLALAHEQQALDLYRAIGLRRQEAAALNGVGWCHILLGNPQRALVCCRQALDVLQKEVGDRWASASTWDSMGYAHHHLGQYDDAVDCYRNALDLFDDLGDRQNQADTLDRLGDTQCAAGDRDAARHSWQLALHILEDLDHSDVELVRTKLVELAESYATTP
jgi:DNA-binding SARP family transcriptional activator/tetratricopeptide (TPR) repeat protein